MGNIVVAYDKKGKPVTTSDLEVAGAMCAWMRNTINPTLMSSTEDQPCLVHAGPFANIAVGQSSIIADRVGLKMFDYHVTESGFAADIGFEKFWNVKSRLSGLTPNVSDPDDNDQGIEDARRGTEGRSRTAFASGIHKGEPGSS